MRLCEAIIGNLEEPRWQESLQGARVAHLDLDEWELKKSRLRRTASDGTDVAVNLDRGTTLKDGDIVAWEPSERWAVVVKVHPKEVLHIRLEEAPPDQMIERAMRLGHLLGNQHWPATVVGRSIYVPLAVSREVMSSVLKTHAIAGVTFAFESGHGLDLPAMAHHSHEHPHQHDRRDPGEQYHH